MAALPLNCGAPTDDIAINVEKTGKGSNDEDRISTQAFDILLAVPSFTRKFLLQTMA